MSLAEYIPRPSLRATPRMLARSLALAIAVLTTAHAASRAHAAVPIGGGHYRFDTPQSDGRDSKGRWTNEDAFGAGWSMHIWPMSTQFTKYAFIDVELTCRDATTQLWRFHLDSMPFDTARGRTRLSPVPISASGAFAAHRPGGIFTWDGSTTDPERHTAWMSITGQFISRTQVRGRLLVNSSAGCTSGWLPVNGRNLRDGWQELLDRT